MDKTPFFDVQLNQSPHDAKYFYNEYRKALKHNRKGEKLARKSVNRLCVLITVQICFMILLQIGVLYALSVFSRNFNGFPYQKVAESLFSYNSFSGLLFISAFYVFCVFIPFGVYAAVRRSREGSSLLPHSSVSFNKVSALPFATAIFVSIGIGVLAKWINVFVMAVLDNAGYPIPQLDFSWPAFLPAQLMFIIVLAVLPAFIEEFNYRGVVLGELAGYNMRGAVIFSSLLFSIMHCNAAQFLYAFIIGLSISYFVLKFKSLWIGVAIHLAFNLYGTAFPLAMDSVIKNQMHLGVLILALDLLLVYLGFVFFVFFIVKYRSALPKTSSDKLSVGRFSYVVFTSFAFYILLAVAGIVTMLNTLP